LQAAASDKLHESDAGSDATDAADLESVPASETVAAQTQPSQRSVHYLRFLQAIHAATAHVSYALEHRAQPQRLATTATAVLLGAARLAAHRSEALLVVLILLQLTLVNLLLRRLARAPIRRTSNSSHEPRLACTQRC
jgi:hypothetical protein